MQCISLLMLRQSVAGSLICKVKLSVGARQELMQFREEFRHKKSKFVWLFRDNPRKQKLTDEIFNSLGYSTTSLMVFPLGLKFQELLGGGSLILSSESESKFSQQHVELLSLVREPFAIALSNALKHRSELKLYDRDFFGRLLHESAETWKLKKDSDPAWNSSPNTCQQTAFTWKGTKGTLVRCI